MGFWNASPEGHALQPEDTGLMWGDDPADIFDFAVLNIGDSFKRSLGRRPTKAELIAGLKYSLGGYDEP